MLQKPLLFISFDKRSKNFFITPEAINFLKSIKEDVKIICIAGPYRSGKSYLLNRFRGSQSGFELGPTTEAKTQGIWIWGEAIPDQDGNVFILLDTEGLGDTKKEINYDIKIFVLSVLLSSSLLFNRLGNIDERSITELNLVCDMASMIQVSEDTNMQDKAQKQFNENKFMEFFPSLHYVVRDFVLLLQDSSGRAITPDQYLEDCLKLKGTEEYNTDDVDDIMRIVKTNTVKKNIRNFFPNRHCWVLPRPVNEEEDLQRVDEIAYDNLRKEFQVRCNELMTALKNQTPIFKLKNPNKDRTGIVSVNGPGLLEIATYYVDCINNGKLPVIEHSFNSMCDLANQSALKEALQVYVNNMEKIHVGNSNHVPLDFQEIYRFHNESLQQSINMFKKSAKGNTEILNKYLDKLNEEISVEEVVTVNNIVMKLPKRGKFFEYYHTNKIFSEKYCMDIIESLCDNLQVQCNNMSDSKQFEDAFHNAIAQYKSRAKGVAVTELEKNLLDRIDKIKQEFFLNKKISKLEQERLAEQIQIQQQVQQITQLEEKCKEAELQRKTEANILNEKISALGEKFNRDKDELNKHHQTAIEQLKQEQMKFIEQNQINMAEMSQKQINMMEASHKREMENMQNFFTVMTTQNTKSVEVLQSGLNQLAQGIKSIQESSERATQMAIEAMNKKESGGGILGKLVDIVGNVAEKWVKEKLFD